MDYGAGSGVLGLAALVFGASEAWGVEIDPDSISAAHANAAINNQPGFKCYLPALTACSPSAAAGTQKNCKPKKHLKSLWIVTSTQP